MDALNSLKGVDLAKTERNVSLFYLNLYIIKKIDK